jgi:hypothetical protein
MRKTGLLIALIVLLLGASVPAQKKFARARILPPVGGSQKIILQDDFNAGYLVFDPGSGAYECVMCEYEYKMTGNGSVKVDGCTVYFSDIQDTYRVVATLDLCVRDGKCAVEMFKLSELGYDIEPIYESWGDSNLLDNTADCSLAPKKE